MYMYYIILYIVNIYSLQIDIKKNPFLLNEINNC